MSVPAPERGPSEPEFLMAARALERETRHRCVNGPKRYTFFGLQELYQTARRIYSAAKRANSINPINQSEVYERRHLFTEAICWAEDYNSQMELLLDEKIFEAAASKKMIGLAAKAKKLLTGIRKSDCSRYKNIPK